MFMYWKMLNNYTTQQTVPLTKLLDVAFCSVGLVKVVDADRVIYTGQSLMPEYCTLVPGPAAGLK